MKENQPVPLPCLVRQHVFDELVLVFDGDDFLGGIGPDLPGFGHEIDAVSRADGAVEPQNANYDHGALPVPTDYTGKILATALRVLVFMEQLGVRTRKRNFSHPKPSNVIIVSLDNATKNDTIISMNSKQLRTLKRIFDSPTRSDVTWVEVESLLRAQGATFREGPGSQVWTSLGQALLSIHKPHPQKELKKYALERVRDFLREVGLAPESSGGNQQ